MGLNDVLRGLSERRVPKSGHGLLDALLAQIATAAAKGGLGGLDGLIGRFTGAGFGAKANSWVGSGENHALEPDEVEDALGPEQVERIATAAGMTRAEATSGLADLIPTLVDSLSPNGALPTGSPVTALRRLDVGALVGR